MWTSVAPAVGGFAGVAEDVFVGEFVGAGFAALAVEFAEFAGEGADVGSS